MDETLSMLQTTLGTVDAPQRIEGVPNYDILMNPEYSMAFQYVPAFAQKRNIIIQDGDKDETNDHQSNDVVRLALNLAMFPDRAIADAKFATNSFEYVSRST
jgi:hypothetical protein